MGIKVDLKINKDWLYADGGKNSFAISKFINACKNEFGEELVEEEKTAFEQCSIYIGTSENEDELLTKLDSLLKENVNVPDKSIYSISLNGKERIVEATLQSPKKQDLQEYKSYGKENTKEEKEGGVLNKINSLVGAESFKSLCNDIYSRAELIKKNKSQNAFFSRSYLFSINQGEGYTHSLKLLSELLKETKLLTNSTGEDIREVELPEYNAEFLTERMDMVRTKLKAYLKRGGIISYDISSWIGHTGSEEFKKLLMLIFKENAGCVNIFKIPVVADKRMTETLEDIKDILSVQEVYYEPFGYEEMQQIAQNIFDEANITTEKSIWNIFNKKIDEERGDGHFYGINTIKKIVNEMIHHMESYDVKMNTEHSEGWSVVTADKIRDMIDQKKNTEISAVEELKNLIGMQSVKDQVHQIVRQIELAHSAKNSKMPSMHMCFIGNPGTGKTTVARIIGKIMKEKGLLRIGKFYEYKGRDLCGKYVGWTADITTKICKEAYGSVLFIDEAYSLFRGEGGRDYGQEALDTLISEMENHSDDFIVIFAGYPGDIETMLTGNEGMRSRIPYIIEFPNYSKEELAEIFFKYACAEGYDESFKNSVNEHFKGLSDELMKRKDFGNARYVRNLYERTRGKAMIRTADSVDKELSLTASDFHQAVKELEEKKATKKAIGFQS